MAFSYVQSKKSLPIRTLINDILSVPLPVTDTSEDTDSQLPGRGTSYIRSPQRLNLSNTVRFSHPPDTQKVGGCWKKELKRNDFCSENL
ncbi:hypothetical protein CEXT_190411 [Caerostris extrusa]|uniref:Uncharacterized protein n=1 Tax=Caerostris extrusa TaxID=172846 RepID=A0AAV4V390_CAEEX|nr:hypothetical protein CEXT_190411 [Caerostris extrusa]